MRRDWITEILLGYLMTIEVAESNLGRGECGDEAEWAWYQARAARALDLYQRRAAQLEGRRRRQLASSRRYRRQLRTATALSALLSFVAVRLPHKEVDGYSETADYGWGRLFFRFYSGLDAVMLHFGWFELTADQTNWNPDIRFVWHGPRCKRPARPRVRRETLDDLPF